MTATCVLCEYPTRRGSQLPTREYVCPSCEHFIDDYMPCKCIETVLIIAGGRVSSKKAHIPSDDGKPLCGRTPRERQIDQGGAIREKDRKQVPHHDLCDHCLAEAKL